MITKSGPVTTIQIHQRPDRLCWNPSGGIKKICTSLYERVEVTGFAIDASGRVSQKAHWQNFRTRKTTSRIKAPDELRYH
jgi:hypothetical protein